MSDKPVAKSQRVEKPWGHEIIWARTDHYVGKILFLKAGHSLSLQYHNKKEETMYFEQGECQLETGPNEKSLRTFVFGPGEAFHVTPGTLHRLTAKTDCRIFEVSTNHLDDVVRLKDNYGRA